MDQRIRNVVEEIHNERVERIENAKDIIRQHISNLSGMERNNTFVIKGYTIYNIVLLLCYLLEVVKKARTIGYFAIFATLSIVPLLVMRSMYKHDHESEDIKKVLAYGYIIFYVFTIFTTISPVAFTYGILIALFIMAYGDEKLTKRFAVSLFTVNVANVAYMALKHQITAEDLPNIEIRIGFTLLYAIFMVMATNTLVKNNEEKMNHIREEKEAVSEMLHKIMEISEKMIKDIDYVSGQMLSLEASVEKTKYSMQEVSNGTNDTADSVQCQLVKTEEIQNFIDEVLHVSNQINNDMNDASDEVSIGKKKIDELIGQVKISDDASSKVSNELGKLTEYASQMQSIVALIDGITSQTSLLALNASIEAARAGEVGRGFAVVASEISNLAEQTQSATVEITDLISNISAELDEVVSVINYLMDNSKLQSLAATDTASSFETIASRTEDIQRNTNKLAGLIEELSTSNESIVDSIQTISSATEEVTAHSNETLQSSEENSEIVNEVGKIVERLESLAQSLNSLS